jgi:hypothetical protein
MSSSWIQQIRRASQNPFAARFKAMSALIAQYDAHNTQIEASDMPNAIKVDNSIIQYREDSKVTQKSESVNFYLPFEPDLDTLSVWYKFDSWTSGQVSDASFFNNHGFIRGGTSTGTNGPDKGFGPTVAYGFDGSRQNIQVGEVDEIVANGDVVGFSVATLVYPSTFSPTITGQYRYIASKIDDNDYMWVLFIDIQGNVHFWNFVAGVSHSIVTNNPIMVRSWNWVVATFDVVTNTPKLYINGIFVSTSTDIPTEASGPTGDFAHAPNDLFIGSNSGHDGFFQGYMSDFRYYNEKVLNLFEAQNLAMNYYSISYIPYGQVLIVGLGAINPAGTLPGVPPPPPPPSRFTSHFTPDFI